MVSIQHFTTLHMVASRMVAICLSVLFLTLSMNAGAAELTAKVDRQTVIDGESVVLYIEGTDIPGAPDTSALLTNFRVIQSGSSNSQTIVNGKRTQGITMRLELQAKNIGSSVIPAFTVAGVSSDPITIEVVERGTSGVEPRDKVFAELSVDNESPYVQEQVILSLKIFDDGNLASADPSLTGNSNYQIETLPLGREQIVERNGVQYRVNTFRYALFPQQSGEMTIDEITVPASVRDKSYGGNLILLNTPTRRISVRADSIKLTVKPRAAASTSGWWLPVKRLELKHEWSGDIGSAKAGEPFTLTIEMLAAGATSTQLPEISVPDVAGLKIYVDNPNLGSRADADNLVSMRREKWSVIPNRAGQLSLPEVVVKWWDTVNNVEQRAVIPAQQLTVTGTSVTESAAPITAKDRSEDTGNSVAAEVAVLEEAEPQMTSEPVTGSGGDDSTVSLLAATGSATSVEAAKGVSRLWFWLAVLSMLAWLATLIAWWLSVRNRTDRSYHTDAQPDNISEQKAMRRMQSLSREQDASAYSAAVLEWAHSRWPADPVHNLPEVGRRLGSRQLIDDMRRLDQQRFSGTGLNPVSLDVIQKELESAQRSGKMDRPSQSKHALPQL